MLISSTNRKFTGEKMPTLANKPTMLFLAVFMLCPLPALAQKTNGEVYVEPFDYAAGGANLTRASQEGVLLANPALLPWGEKFHRYAGMQYSVLANKESVNLVKSAAKGSKSNQSTTTYVNDLFSDPIHVGFMDSIAWITNNFGFDLFARIEPDIAGKEFGTGGMPVVDYSAEAYAGAVVGFGTRITRWMSLGVTAKYLYVGEPHYEIELTDQTSLKNLQKNPTKLYTYGKGVGGDVGMLFFSQGDVCDLRWALKVDDVGNTHFDNPAQKPFLQTVSTGVGLTLHGSTEALHLSVDYRDIMNAYKEETFKKVYAGAKLLMRNHIGLAAGIYQGYPTAGVRLDLWFMHLGFSRYTRELGSYIGEKRRNIYQAYMGFGF